jgi:hypothetical protein
MESIEQGSVDERSRPEHARGPDYKTAEHTTEREAEELGRKYESDLVAVVERLLVEKALRSHSVSSVRTPYHDIGHDSDNDVLLDVERARIQRPDVAQGVEASGGKKVLETFSQRQSSQLCNDTSDQNAGA